MLLLLASTGTNFSLQATAMESLQGSASLISAPASVSGLPPITLPANPNFEPALNRSTDNNLSNHSTTLTHTQAKLPQYIGFYLVNVVGFF